MKKRLFAVVSAVMLTLSVPLPVSAETAENEDKDIMTVSVVDYDTGELILTDTAQVWAITLQAGFSVEYALTDGTFAWGTSWEDLDSWSYGSRNPNEIDISLYKTGFGVEDFQVVDMYIPDGYFLPEDYLEINYKESDTEHTDFPSDITVKLKKTTMGDVNDDGSFNVSDVVLLQKWLLAVPDTHLANWKAADFCEDDRLDVFDLCLMKRALIGQKSSKEQTLLECEGDRIGFSMEQGWYSTDYSNEITDKQLKDSPDILSRLEKVNEKAEQLKSEEMIDWKWGVDDYGEDYLYLPYIDGNGNADRILLCKFGGDCAWLDDADVQMLVSLLIENGYFADETLFGYYIKNQ